ncbi:bifunctional serine/threonine-protein kinase/ABC transporter substrate-binding protein [Streptomyces sp. NBC_01808]|uniref:bifunctional serine/threonine-protein kinase/ABC transporter substrate-binding protein n=1 Tax=Streptomyces sp. NBC_01808 TaxID=2975947 RepID=UPI002DD9539A|nr:bifunctional serine/threonine-protein kinase/ABC transporter substrate-binding protein [Streptomyces sp. NBC_01808]WSA41763.1 bifunctional serine/threonine-protein kinase/ABC transporter substrate-binding protein [Streptomyces sp. NBC_01808]
MEQLLPSDPAHLGGNRLLGRLGAGGMGVVYLARTPAGAPAAVKVIQPEYAEQPEFRARFRREAASARRVASPWVVPVLDADTEAGAPWLATAFVPGPSLAEAVAACGPLPDHGVRVLGKVLARAVAAVHDAGLVHRDLKPGNVLLALDGPRLIDFGIARPTAAEETELTSDSMVVGTPGFLSPEQARAQRVGPASDVFSLGCVLAYAATGRPPFGTGAADALLYRTVHDEPDLGGLADEGLRALLVRCLAKEAEGRPTAAELDAELVADAPEGDIDWLPDAVVRMVAERSAEMLRLPGVEPTEVSEPAGDAGTAGGPDTTVAAGTARPGRRRVLALAGGAVLLAGGGGAALWAALRDDGEPPAEARGPRRTLGLHADLTGPQKAAGAAQERAARLAVEQFNARKDAPFTLELTVADDRGDPARALTVARRLIGDRDVLAVLGPTGYASAQAALDAYEGAGMPLVTVSEGSFSAAQAAIAGEPKAYFHATALGVRAAYTTVFVLLGQGAANIGLLSDRAGAIRAFEHSTIAHNAATSAELGQYLRVVPAAADAGALGPVVADIVDHGVDSFFYTGTPARAAAVARELAKRGFDGPRFLDEPAAGGAFTAAAADAAEGWQTLTPYVGADADAVRDFAAAYRKRFDGAPGPWAAEAYDVTRLIADRLTALARKSRRKPTREALAASLTAARFKGLTTTYSFDESREIAQGKIHHYRVEDGRFGYVGPVALPGS